jgi:hypothetical protein
MILSDRNQHWFVILPRRKWTCVFLESLKAAILKFLFFFQSGFLEKLNKAFAECSLGGDFFAPDGGGST